MSNEKIAVVGANIQEKASVIWNIANALFGYFKPHEYGLVILPMTVVKRFHDCLLPTHDAVLEQYEKVKKFTLLPNPFTMESGELTNSLKIKRRVVYEKYADMINRMYEE